MAGQSKRIFLGTKPILPRPEDLINLQLSSWRDFADYQVATIFQNINPINDYTGKNWTLVFENIFFDSPRLTPQQAREKGLTYSAALRAKVRLLNKRTGKETKETVFLADFPWMTDTGTFIIAGVERTVNNQLVRSPGVYFVSETDPTSRQELFRAELRPLHGSWLEFLIGSKGVTHVRIDRRRKFPATILLKAIGLGDDKKLEKIFGKGIRPTLELDPSRTQTEALLEFYRRLRPGEPLVAENARGLLKNMFFDTHTYSLGMVGRHKINKRLGLKFDEENSQYWVLQPADIEATVHYLLGLTTGKETKLDDIDHLANRRLRRVSEILTQSILRRAMLRFERVIRERMSLVSVKEKVRASQIVNGQPLINTVNTFFKTNQLSSILDQTSPLSELDLLRKVTVTGPEGITRERATFSIRDIHSSQYGRICPVRSPEGMNIGLVTYLALFVRVNKYGFLETPYWRVKSVKRGGKTLAKVTKEMVYLQADDEMDYYITLSGVKMDKDGFIRDEIVPVRHQGRFFEAKSNKVQLIDYCSQQILGLSAALIPFIAHDETNRALMGSNMQCQAVPLVSPEAPLVGTGVESIVPRAMQRIGVARAAGKVTYVDAEKIIVKPSKRVALPESDSFKIENGAHIYQLFRHQRTSPNGTCYSQRPVVQVGQSVKKGQLLADGPATENGELALGRNLVVAYACIDGLGYEDAIVIADSLVKDDVLTSIEINEYEAKVVDTKLGPEELTRDIPGVSEADLARLTGDGIVMIGAEVGPNDILVGKVEPKGQKELTAEERLLRAIFGEKAKEVRDTSLRVPNGESGVVIGVKILDRDKNDELEIGVNKVVRVAVAQLRKIQEGDKVAGRHGNKGVVAKVMPVQDMPYLEDGTPVDILISPLSVIARMNLGQLLEAHLGMAAQKLNQKYAVASFNKLPESVIRDLLSKAGFPADGKMVLFDGKTGTPLEQKVMVGVGYINKLHHMVEDKIHARSTGPYSLVTQQPLGGKARMGGQRFGEMEVWALEAHRAAYTLQEMLTIKSDDTIGRTQAFRAIIKGQDTPHPALPESFRVLVRELAGLSLEVSPVGVVRHQPEPTIREARE